MTPEEITTLIMDYIDEVIARKVSDNRINLDRLSTSFQAWENTYMGKYDGDEFVKHSTLRQLMYQLDAVYDYNLSNYSNEALDRVLWVNPNLNALDNPTVGGRALIAAQTNLVLTGAGVKPVLHANPLDVGFDLKNNITLGGLAYNQTDDTWYYARADGTIANLAHSGGGITVDELDAILPSSSHFALLSGNFNTHVSDTNIHTPPDNDTVKIVAGTLQAQLHTFGNPFSVVDRHVTLKYTADFTLDASGNLAFNKTIPDITALQSQVDTNTANIASNSSSISSLDTRVLALESGGPSAPKSSVFTLTDSVGADLYYIKAVGTSLGIYNASNILIAQISSTGILTMKDEITAYGTL